MEVAIIILSHKRAGRVTTHRYVAGAKICVPKSQADEYAQFHPKKALVVHPDSVVGLFAKRQWVYKKFKNVMMLDDDSRGLRRVYIQKDAPIHKRRTIQCRPDRAAEIVQATARTAKRLGAFLFGFASHCNPLTYYPSRPFSFGGYTPGGSLGLLAGSKLYWPKKCTLPVDDYWVCLLNAFHHRYAYYDRRFAWSFAETYRGLGGLAEFLPDGSEDAGTEFLVRQFGGDIVVRLRTPKSVTKREYNPSPRKIRLPWRA